MNLSSEESATAGGDSGPAWASQAPWDSSIWQAIESGAMPPDDPLPNDEVQQVRQWIEQGMLWPEGPIDPLAASTDARAGYDWWAFQPISDDVMNASFPLALPSSLATPSNSPIDGFVDRELEKRNLHRSPQAAPRLLARRVFYGLTGLPPTIAELQAFVADDSLDTYETLVDRLLASPEFGERFGRHWLDLVRFGETNGFEYDEPRNHFWRYRNWVVQAFNKDMPYDAFAQMQLAGDAIGDEDSEGAIATGFLVAGPHNTTRPVGNELAKLAMQEEETEELVGTIGQTFLGMTVNCARCHDHKFDPISQANYYEFAANFAGVAHGEKEIQFPLPRPEQSEQQRIEQALEQTQTQIELLQANATEEIESLARSTYPQFATMSKPLLQWPSPLAGRISQDRIWTRIGSQDDTSQRIRDGGVVLDGKTNYLESVPLVQSIQEKSLSAWVLLDHLEQQGGGVLSIATQDERHFDSIVFGEQRAGEWLVGSEHFKRTKGLDGPAESKANRIPVHIAVTYRSDGLIEVYRNGKPYGTSYNVGEQVLFGEAGYRLLIGLRHKPAGGNRLLQGVVYYAALFDRVLTAEEIQSQASEPFLEMQRFLSMGYGEMENGFAEPLVEGFIDELNKLLHHQAQLRKRLQEIQQASRAKVYTSVGRPTGENRIYRRGEVAMPGEIVSPSPLDAVNQTGKWESLPADATDRQRREHAAKWIASPDNPLFARVIANRIWMYHMGSSLVDTPSDFGFNGGQPTHPELLDYLAKLLIDNEFQLKPVHRAILLSETYKQSSKASEAGLREDAGNRWYWRKTPQRLEAEEVRDSLLAISNRLGFQRTGPGYRDMQQAMEKGTNVYTLIDVSDEPVQPRTLYRFTTRGSRNPFLDNFDCPDPSVTTPKRSATTTPLQALSLLNNPLVFSVCNSMANAILEQEDPSLRPSEADSMRDQVIGLYERILQRSPTQEEQIDALEFAKKHGIAGLCRVLFNTNEFLYVP